MSSRVATLPHRLADLENLYAPVAAELADVEAFLVEALRSPLPFVDELLQHTSRYSGKRLRPVLLLLSGKACGPLTHDHIVLGAVIEIIHTATLVHDDVLDGAALRRHVATVHAEWGVESSVLLGDFLFSQAFYLAAGTGRADACRIIGETTNTVCAGELQQISHRGDLGLSERQYRDIINRKTGWLCGCSCRLGAALAGAEPDMADVLDRYGRLFGMAFQIVDDILDLVGREGAAGKSLGTDMAEQKPTLPLVRLVATAEPAQLAHIEDLWQSTDPDAAEQLRAMVLDSPHVDSARLEAKGLLAQASNGLAGLPVSPARDALGHLARFVLDRDF